MGVTPPNYISGLIAREKLKFNKRAIPKTKSLRAQLVVLEGNRVRFTYEVFTIINKSTFVPDNTNLAECNVYTMTFRYFHWWLCPSIMAGSRETFLD
jgi:hypothetical protein